MSSSSGVASNCSTSIPESVGASASRIRSRGAMVACEPTPVATVSKGQSPAWGRARRQLRRIALAWLQHGCKSCLTQLAPLDRNQCPRGHSSTSTSFAPIAPAPIPSANAPMKMHSGSYPEPLIIRSERAPLLTCLGQATELQLAGMLLPCRAKCYASELSERARR